jgi:hypothetical protein
MSYHCGLVGSGIDTTIAAYGSSVTIDADETKVWTCPACTFHNAETLGRFCSMCGSSRKQEEHTKAIPAEPPMPKQKHMPVPKPKPTAARIRISSLYDDNDDMLLEPHQHKRNSNYETPTQSPRKREIRRSEPNCKSLQEMYNEVVERRNSCTLRPAAQADPYHPRNSQPYAEAPAQQNGQYDDADPYRKNGYDRNFFPRRDQEQYVDPNTGPTTSHDYADADPYRRTADVEPFQRNNVRHHSEPHIRSYRRNGDNNRDPHRKSFDQQYADSAIRRNSQLYPDPYCNTNGDDKEPYPRRDEIAVDPYGRVYSDWPANHNNYDEHAESKESYRGNGHQERVQPRQRDHVVEDTHLYGRKTAPPFQEEIDDFSLSFSPEVGKKQTVGLRPTEEKEGEGSFTVGNLVDPDPFDTDTSKLTQNHAATPVTLNETDFQMSFANWSISDQGTWTCIACTYANTNPLHLTCEVCCQKRPGKTAANQAEKAMQSIFENSIRTGQHDFLKIQQDKIEEIEERVIAAERMHEIKELQENLMEEYHDAANSNAPAREENIQLSRQWISELEEVREQEVEEQENMEHYLEGKRQTLGLQRMDSQRALLPPKTRALSGLESTPQALEIRGEERMLSQWKHQFDERNADVQRIRKRQQEIYEKLQNKN